MNENLSPFSFFNYIVYNSSLYSESELQSILLHEKIHSAQKHSFDVLVTNLFSIVFWFNPFMYLYKKAVTQNLEYIADSEAIAQIDDKKAYQMALLKVVSHQNCLPITNHFYQSLIKKRIVMLNKNQSNKRNSWKYAVIIPALVAFVILFQVKVIAQEKLITLEDGSQITSTTQNIVEMNWNKNSPDEEFENDAIEAKKSGVDFTFSNIKRNKNNEITHITISYHDEIGNQFTKEFSKKEGIDPIYFRRSIDQNGKGEIGFYFKNKTEESEKKEFTSIYNSHYESDTEENLDRLFIINGKQYTKEDLKGKNIELFESKIVKLNSEEALKKYGLKAKDGAII
ncbi:MAG TPA: peptidase M56, partial [Flavobacterium sp.]|nr:peptidase M56 [Flavobacterium sp.]